MEKLNLFLEKIKARSENYIGYPAATDYDIKELEKASNTKITSILFRIIDWKKYD